MACECESTGGHKWMQRVAGGQFWPTFVPTRTAATGLIAAAKHRGQEGAVQQVRERGGGRDPNLANALFPGQRLIASTANTVPKATHGWSNQIVFLVGTKGGITCQTSARRLVRLTRRPPRPQSS